MKTIAQQMNVKEFPFYMYDANGNVVYQENSSGFWSKFRYDTHDNKVYSGNSKGVEYKFEYDEWGNQIYYENSFGYCSKREFDESCNEVYYENSDGDIIDNRPKQVKEVSMADVEKKFGHTVKIVKE